MKPAANRAESSLRRIPLLTLTSKASRPASAFRLPRQSSVAFSHCHLRRWECCRNSNRYPQRLRTRCGVFEEHQSDEPQDHPTDDARQRMIEDLTRRLQVAERALQESEDRQRALAPYRVSAPKRGIVGNSSYAVRLRSQIIAASRDRMRNPVLIFGEPGLQKDNIAALIHFGSPDAKWPLVSIECDR